MSGNQLTKGYGRWGVHFTIVICLFLSAAACGGDSNGMLHRSSRHSGRHQPLILPKGLLT